MMAYMICKVISDGKDFVLLLVIGNVMESKLEKYELPGQASCSGSQPYC